MINRIVLTLLLVWGGAVRAQTDTRFIYQGVLQDVAGVTAQSYDFRVRLFDGPEEFAVEMTNALEFFGVPVLSGAFVLELDFGAVILGGPERWLQIEVRRPNAIVFGVLTPRQRVSSVPVAMVADVVDWNSLVNTPAGFADGQDDDLLASLGCGDQELLAYSAVLQAWQCIDPPVDTVRSYAGSPPIDVDNVTEVIGLNPATSPGDLLTWDGNNWIAQQPAQPPLANPSNMQPYLGINYIIALAGIYPSGNSANPFIAEIIMFGGNFAPRDWAFCNGQLLSIASNSALFSLLGATYGGDSRTTFALPDLRGRVPLHPGSGPGLTNRRLGERAGSETVSHSH